MLSSKKYTLWGLRAMRALKREIQISHVKKNLIFSAKKFTFRMELEVFFKIIQQTYSKLVISFMNRKSSCGYATHFFILKLDHTNS
jgi:P2-related tail formation protein